MWKSPRVLEVAVGLEINCYACAEIQKVAGPGNKTPKPRSNPIPLDQLDFARSRTIIEKLFPNAKINDIEKLMQLYGVKQRHAHGGKVKKTYAKGGGIRKAKTYG